MRTQRTRSLKRATITLLLGTILFWAIPSSTLAAQRPGRSAAGRRQVAIPEIRTTDQLKEAFERDAGKVRLVALLSPT